MSPTSGPNTANLGPNPTEIADFCRSSGQMCPNSPKSGRLRQNLGQFGRNLANMQEIAQRSAVVEQTKFTTIPPKISQRNLKLSHMSTQILLAVSGEHLSRKLEICVRWPVRQRVPRRHTPRERERVPYACPSHRLSILRTSGDQERRPKSVPEGPRRLSPTRR